MVHAARIVAAALVACAVAALVDGALGLAEADWEACVSNSLDALSGDPAGLTRLAEGAWSQWLAIFLASMTSPFHAFTQGFPASWIALEWAPPFLLALPALAATDHATRRAFQLALVGFTLSQAALLLPPEALHDCDRKGVEVGAYLIGPILALVWAGVALALCVLFRRR